MADLDRLADPIPPFAVFDEFGKSCDDRIQDWAREYAALAVRQQRERDAEICKEHAADAWDHEGGALWCAAAILAQSETKEGK